MNRVPTDLWLKDIVSTKISESDALDDICENLAGAANDAMFMSGKYGAAGFHVGSIVTLEGGATIPVAYHVHRGHDHSQLGKFKVYKDFPYNQDLTLEEFQEKIARGMSYFLINGHHERFQHLFNSIVSHIYKLGQEGMKIPFPASLESHVKLAKIIVGLMCDLYSISNEPSSVARPVSSLTIGMDGNVTFESPLSNIGAG